MKLYDIYGVKQQQIMFFVFLPFSLVLPIMFFIFYFSGFHIFFSLSIVVSLLMGIIDIYLLYSSVLKFIPYMKVKGHEENLTLSKVVLPKTVSGKLFVKITVDGKMIEKPLLGAIDSKKIMSARVNDPVHVFITGKNEVILLKK